MRIPTNLRCRLMWAVMKEEGSTVIVRTNTDTVIPRGSDDGWAAYAKDQRGREPVFRMGGGFTGVLLVGGAEGGRLKPHAVEMIGDLKTHVQIEPNGEDVKILIEGGSSPVDLDDVKASSRGTFVFRGTAVGADVVGRGDEFLARIGAMDAAEAPVEAPVEVAHEAATEPRVDAPAEAPAEGCVEIVLSNATGKSGEAYAWVKTALGDLLPFAVVKDREARLVVRGVMRTNVIAYGYVTARPVDPVDVPDGGEILARLAAMAEKTGLSDDHVLAGARMGKGFWGAWAGDYDGKPEDADAFVAGRLAFYLGNDPERLVDLFSRSKLAGRGRWAESESYRNDVVRWAISSRSKAFQPTEEALKNLDDAARKKTMQDDAYDLMRRLKIRGVDDAEEFIPEIKADAEAKGYNFDDYLVVCRKKYKAVKAPLSALDGEDVVNAAIKLAEAKPYPAVSRWENYRKAVSIAYHMSRIVDDGVFFFAKPVALHFGVNVSTPKDWLTKMVDQGLIVLHKKQPIGSRLCDHYRWVGPLLDQPVEETPEETPVEVDPEESPVETIPPFERATPGRVEASPRVAAPLLPRRSTNNYGGDLRRFLGSYRSRDGWPSSGFGAGGVGPLRRKGALEPGSSPPADPPGAPVSPAPRSKKSAPARRGLAAGPDLRQDGSDGRPRRMT